MSNETPFVLLLYEIIYIAHAYDLQCPESGQRSILNQRHCNKTHMYACIFNENEAHYESNCQQPIQQRPGYEVTKLGGVNSRQCPNEMFQPVKFWTNETSKCMFKKSVCSDEGSVLTNNGTTRTDVKCRCDYTKGYNFINKPRDKCECVPSEEDCSCFLVQCPGQQMLSQDYTCTDQNWSGSFVCREILSVDISECPSTAKTTIVEAVTRTTTIRATRLIPMLLTVCVIMVLVIIFLVKDMGLLVELIYQPNTSLRTKDNIRTSGSRPLVKSSKRHGISEDYHSSLQDPIMEDLGNQDNVIGLHSPLTVSNVELCKILLEHSTLTDINKTDKENQTPLIHACNMSDEMTALFLIKKGADVNLTDNLGNTPLILATNNGLLTVVTKLLELNADVNAVNNNCSTALSLACRNGFKEIIILLLKQNSDPNILDKEGWTPLIHAIHYGEIERLKEND